MTKVLHFKSEKKTLPDNNFIVTCKIIGAIDGRTVYDFEQKIRGFFDQGAKHLVLNFAEVTYINSTGMGLLVKLSDIFQSSEGNIRLVSVPEKVIALFDMLGLLSLFKIYESEQEAIMELTQSILKKTTAPQPKEKEPQININNNTNTNVRRKTPVPPDMPKFKKTPTSLEEKMGATPLVIDDDSKTQAVQFPYVGDCAVCRRKIEFATPGNYKCNSCSSYISVDINGQQKVHARFNSDVIELTFPCNIYHKNVALFAINGLVQQLGYSTYFWEDIKEVLDSALTIALEKNYLQGKEKLHLLAVADREEMVIGLKSMNLFLDPNGPKDPRLPAIARKLDKLEVFPLPTRGQLLKMTKRNVSSMQPAM